MGEEICLPWVYVQRRLRCFMNMQDLPQQSAHKKETKYMWYCDIGYCLDRIDHEWPVFEAWIEE